MTKQVLGILAASGIVATPAFGAFTTAQLLDVTRLAVVAFETENPDHAVHLTGYKAWKSGQNARIKIYIDHNGHAMEFDYTCHDHDGELECLAD